MKESCAAAKERNEEEKEFGYHCALLLFVFPLSHSVLFCLSVSFSHSLTHLLPLTRVLSLSLSLSLWLSFISVLSFSLSLSLYHYLPLQVYP